MKVKANHFVTFYAYEKFSQSFLKLMGDYLIDWDEHSKIEGQF